VYSSIEYTDMCTLHVSGMFIYVHTHVFYAPWAQRGADLGLVHSFLARKLISCFCVCVCVAVCLMQAWGAWGVGEVEGSVAAWVILALEEAEDIESDLGEPVWCNPTSVPATCLTPEWALA